MQHTVIFELESCEIISLMCQLGAQVVIYYNLLQSWVNQSDELLHKHVRTLSSLCYCSDMFKLCELSCSFVFELFPVWKWILVIPLIYLSSLWLKSFCSCF